ncbi:MAG: PD-(D/E)XK nuclease family protein, partial [Prevotellaceae bacterium]|nr:PD-(D/E)XK nuclease family protein [Prevotellaceae bacterium]
YREYQADVSRFTFVFPNKRAGVFFQRYLSQLLDEALFSPEVLSISECFSSVSKRQPADRLSNLFRLYDVYRSVGGSGEGFDSFVFWGEMLLSDFDEIDKYLIDARQLFTNITDLKQIDEVFDTLTPRQKEAIKEFWNNFIPVTEGRPKTDYITTWKILYPVYKRFQAGLAAENLATEGMMCRELAENLKSGQHIPEWDEKQFVFVGFNALNACERELFNALKKEGKADFYFDYEAAELRDADNLASQFYEENIRQFPSNFPLAQETPQNPEREMELIAVPSEIGQAKEIYSILNGLFPNNNKEIDPINTAVVLADENLLIPLLHSLPAQIEQVNVTMGFPLKSTPASGLLEYVLELQRRARVSGGKVSFYYKNVLNILNHQYISLCCGGEAKAIEERTVKNNRIYVEAEEFSRNSLLASVFTLQTNALDFLSYLTDMIRQLQAALQNSGKKDEHLLTLDFLYQYYVTLNRMQDVLKKRREEIPATIDTMARLIRQALAGISLPFEGEPLAGLQIMGVLETRCLDFENLVIPSFNEGIFPKRSVQNSFIPYTLRRCFGLPVANFQDAISAYHFYRLIHRAKRIFLLYDSRADGMKTGEVSRFMHQLHYHYGVDFKRRNLSFDVGFENRSALQVAKTPEIMKKLERFTIEGEKAAAFSASSLNTYIDCPLKFYLTQMERIEESDEVIETVEGSMFGTLFHAVMENLYQPYTGKTVESGDIKQLVEHPLKIDAEIARAFAVEFFRKKDGSPVALEGNNLLIARVIRKYVRQMLKIDMEYAPFTCVASELPCSGRLPVFGGRMQVNLKGFIDRIDEKDSMLRILDYKTGSGKPEFKSIAGMFEHNNENRPKYEFQIFLYALLYKRMTGAASVLPGISFLRNVFKSDYTAQLRYKPEPRVSEPVDDFNPFEEAFVESLTACLEEIFDPDIPFVQTEKASLCTYCPYTSICGR